MKVNYTYDFDTELTSYQNYDLNLYLLNLERELSKQTDTRFRLIDINSQLKGGYLSYIKEDGEFSGLFILFTNQVQHKQLKINFEEFSSNKVPVFICYLFNYTSFEQLSKRLTSISKNYFKRFDADKRGYYDVLLDKVAYQPYGDTYNYENQLESPNSYPFYKGMITDKADAELVRGFVNRLVSDLDSEIPDLKLLECIHSNESEACYIHILHFVIPQKKMKISIRNHPLNTQSQMVFYLYNFKTYAELKARFLEVMREFDWDNYQYNAYKYYDVTNDDIIYKRVGDDLEVYSDEQLAYVESMRMERMMNKEFKPLIIHPTEQKAYKQNKNQNKNQNKKIRR